MIFIVGLSNDLGQLRDKSTKLRRTTVYIYGFYHSPPVFIKDADLEAQNSCSHWFRSESNQADLLLTLLSQVI